MSTWARLTQSSRAPLVIQTGHWLNRATKDTNCSTPRNGKRPNRLPRNGTVPINAPITTTAVCLRRFLRNHMRTCHAKTPRPTGGPTSKHGTDRRFSTANAVKITIAETVIHGEVLNRVRVSSLLGIGLSNTFAVARIFVPCSIIYHVSNSHMQR